MQRCAPMNFALVNAMIICNWEGMTTPPSSPGTRLTDFVERMLKMWPLMCLMDR